jgi:tetratricopeptide (TPR) repeat protein
MKMKKQFLYILLLLTFAVNAQEKDKNLPKGDENFEAKKYADAESEYRLSQSKFNKKAKSSYNLGTTIYKQKQPGEAKYQFEKAAKDAKTKPEKHKAFHNLGNTLMSEKNYAGAVEAYKNALRNNPADEETRYNYALAKKMLKDNPPKDDKNKEKNKDKNKDKKDDKKDQDKDKKDDKKDNPDKDKKDDKEGQNPQPKPNDVSKQKIENLLNAVNNEEKKVQDKVKGQKMQAPVKAEKDW